ncbi:Signal peptide, CUB and EGF-like domain-containing 1 [Paramuricea clavata]|nr:Signal peptide, CUB and EGF-like domain-containing 1 [Paramuricea clavata]
MLRAFEICSSENAPTPSYDLCDIGPALTSLNGSIYATLGMDCSRVILAPKGYRIEVNITKNTKILEAKAMYIVDGATKFHKLERAGISRHRVLENHIAISTSNAILIHIDKITSTNTNVEITYKMFEQPPERCICLPVTHGETVCSFTSVFYRDDSLTKECTVVCGQNRFIANRYFFHDFKMQCFMGDPEHDLSNKGKWNAIGQFETLFDDQLVTCARIFPATRIKLGYKFTYTNVSCVQVDATAFEAKIQEYISNIQSVSNECQNGTRRKMNEATCVVGVRSYPEPSQKYCKHTCNVGKYFNINSSICEWCPYGMYQNSTIIFNPQCTPCPNGLTTGFVGARNESECINLCPGGFYLKYTRCLKCDVGYFMTNASHRLPRCYQCPSGYTTLDVATIDSCVKKCTVGEYFNMTLQNCTLCPNNTYQNETSDTNTRICKKCPQNTATATVGSTMFSDCLGPCSSGQYIDVGLQKCSPCSRNTYQDVTQHVSFSCKSCGQYKITLKTASTNFSECIYTCSKGRFFNLTSKVCEQCPINLYQDELGRDACKPCQGKTLTVKNGSEKCISPCGFGEFLNKSAEKCLKCPEGFYQNVSEYTSDICHPCPTDFYSDKSGQSNCTRCKDGSITLITGATNEDECIETCQSGYYLNKTARSCQKCVKGFYQDRTGFKDEFCTKCKSANLTTLGNGAKSEEECVGYCASSPCLNGAICSNIENDFNCSCPNFLTGKQCETVVDRKNSDTMEISIRFPDIIWTENLQNPESSDFKKLALRIESSIRAEFKNDNIFRTVKVVGFRKGSVISDVQFTYVGGVSFVTPVDKLTTVVSDGSLGNLTVDSSSVTITNYTCSQPLGMENRRIPDSALTSGVSRFYHPPKNARLHNQGPGWAPLYFSADEDYLQVDFLEEVWLTGIATQGSSYYTGSWLEAFYIQKSSNGQDWSYFVGEYVTRHIFIANDDIDTVVRNKLTYPVKTRYVRMSEYAFKNWISFRVEFYGCPIPKAVPLPTLSPWTPSVTPRTLFPSQTPLPTRGNSTTHPSNQTTLFPSQTPLPTRGNSTTHPSNQTTLFPSQTPLPTRGNSTTHPSNQTTLLPTRGNSTTHPSNQTTLFPSQTPLPTRGNSTTHPSNQTTLFPSQTPLPTRGNSTTHPSNQTTLLPTRGNSTTHPSNQTTLFPSQTPLPTRGNSTTHPSNQTTLLPTRGNSTTHPSNQTTLFPSQTPLPTRGTTVVTPDDGDGDDGVTNVGLIVGVTLGVFAVCIIVVVLVVLWWMKRNRGSHLVGYSADVMQLKETK